MRIELPRRALKGAIATLLVCLGTTAASEELFSLEDVFELEWATDPRPAPDGEAVVYVRNFYDRAADRRRSNLWWIDLDSGAQRALTTGLGSNGSPRFSPSGDRLAWIAGTPDGAEIFVRWLATGDVARLTQLPASPRNLTWSPDGTRLAFTMHVDGDGAPPVTLPKAPEGADWAPKAKIVTDLTWRADGQGFLKPGFTHVFVLPADGGTPRQLTAGDHHHDSGLAWMPDGDALIVSANRREDGDRLPRESDLWRIDVASGDLEQLTERSGPEARPTVSSDGRFIAFTGFEDRQQSYQQSKAWRLDLQTGEMTVLTGDLDRAVSGLRYGPRGALYLSFLDEGEGVVARVDRNGRLTRLAEGLGGTSLGRPYAGGQFSINAQGDIAYTRGDDHRPADVTVVKGGDAERITDLNADLLPLRALPDVQTLRWASSHDGLEIQGWFVPAAPGTWTGEGPAPLILEIHGGPHTAYGPGFSAEIQLYAAAGYSVLYANPRGSTSYGEAFANSIHHAYPGYDYDDLIAGVDHAIGLGLADPERLYVTGGSGGGVLSSWIVGTTDRFQAAVVAKPVINWQSFALTTDGSVFWTRHSFPAMPWEDPEHYWARSPLSRVGNVTTPTMLLTGENDLRTPMAESEQYYQALRLRGVDTRLVRIQDASHGITARPTNLMRKVAHVLAWFDEYGGTGEDDGAEAE